MKPQDLWSVFLATEASLRNQGVVDEDVYTPIYHARYKWPEFGNPREWTTQWAPGDADGARRVQVEMAPPKNAVMCKNVPRKPSTSEEGRVEPPPEAESVEQTSDESDEDDEGPPDQSTEPSAVISVVHR
jgi:hypothetical protein